MLNKIRSLSLGLFIVFFGCDIVPAPAPEKEITDPSQLQDYLFSQEEIRTFNLFIDTLALNALDASIDSEEYVVGALEFEGVRYEPVGVRYNGGACKNEDLYERCGKYSLKVKINWDGSRYSRLRGVKKLRFHSMNKDETQLHERLGYYFFREMGVPAPRSTHAKIVLNGEYVGLFALTEQIDDTFLEHRFARDDGNLYSEIWPLTYDTMAQNAVEFLDYTVIKEDGIGNAGAYAIETFAKAFVDENDLGELKDRTSEMFDMEAISAYLVVSRTIKADAGALFWEYKPDYDVSGVMLSDPVKNSDYFWYQEAVNRPMTLIPWAVDKAFTNLNYQNIDGDNYIFTDLFDSNYDCSEEKYSSRSLEHRPAQCDKLIGSWLLFDDLYKSTFQHILDGPLREADSLIDFWVDQMKEPTEAADSLGNLDRLKTEKWLEAVDQLKDDLENARAYALERAKK
ncbi:MAG: CotH kinase family protein [Fibrobacterales bacterium]